MNCLYLLAAKKFHGHIPASLVADVSQGIARQTLRCKGNVATPTGHSKFVFKGEVVPAHKHFWLMGWPRGCLILPSGLSDQGVRSLAGNMISVPQIGQLFAAILCIVTLHSDSDFADEIRKRRA